MLSKILMRLSLLGVLLSLLPLSACFTQKVSSAKVAIPSQSDLVITQFELVEYEKDQASWKFMADEATIGYDNNKIEASVVFIDFLQDSKGTIEPSTAQSP